MKKIIVLLAFLGCSVLGYSQCSIDGNPVIPIGDSQVYSIPSDLGQCSTCFDWDIVSGNVTISGGVDDQNTVTIVANSVGGFRLSVTYFDEEGAHTCYINGICPSTTCNIQQAGVYTLNMLGDPRIKFYTTPNTASPSGAAGNAYLYAWTFDYQNGSTSTSNDREPYIVVSCSNPVIKASVQISSFPGCLKNISKRFTPSGVCGTEHLMKVTPAVKLPDTEETNVSVNINKHLLNFAGKDLQKYKVSIFNVSGTALFKNQAITTPLNWQNLPEGIYIYNIMGTNGYKQTGKIMKQ